MEKEYYTEEKYGAPTPVRELEIRRELDSLGRMVSELAAQVQDLEGVFGSILRPEQEGKPSTGRPEQSTSTEIGEVVAKNRRSLEAISEKLSSIKQRREI